MLGCTVSTIPYQRPVCLVPEKRSSPDVNLLDLRNALDSKRTPMRSPSTPVLNLLSVTAQHYWQMQVIPFWRSHPVPEAPNECVAVTG